MAFAGAPTFALVQEYAAQTNSAIVNISGLSLGPIVAFPPVDANADVGQLSSNNGAIDAVPPFTLSLPAGFGPGPDNWSATDVAALNASIQNIGAFGPVFSAVATLVPNVNPAPAGSSITNANVQIQIQNKAAVPGDVLAIRLQAEHTISLAAS